MRSARRTARRSPLPRRFLRPRSMSRTLAAWLRTPRPGPDHPARAPWPACSTRGRAGRRRRAGRRGRAPPNRSAFSPASCSASSRIASASCQASLLVSAAPRPMRASTSEGCSRTTARNPASASSVRPMRSCSLAIHSRTSTSVGFSATIRSKMASASTVRPDRASCSARSRSVDGDWHVMDRTSAVARGMSMPTMVCDGRWRAPPPTNSKRGACQGRQWR